MIKSRKGQEGFTLIELLVVVLIIGILAAIAIPAFLGQKKGAQDSNAKSLLRNAAIAMESHFSAEQDFSDVAAPATSADLQTELGAIEPNINWLVAGTVADAKADQVEVIINATPFNGYALNTVSQSSQEFSWVRDRDARTAKCKGAETAPAVNGTAACSTGVASW